MKTRFQLRSRAAGFSILEMVAVLAILMTVAGLAIPHMVEITANIRLRSGMSSLAGLIQNCRAVSIRDNKLMTVNFTTLGKGPVAFVKDSTKTATLEALDPQVGLGAPMTHITTLTGVTGAPTALSTTELGYSPQSPDKLVSFNPRGLPCLYASGSCASNNGFVFYFNDQRPLGVNGWAAVTVSPAGRVKVWVWNGSKWGN